MVEEFLNTTAIKFEDKGMQYFEFDDKYSRVYQITFCNNYGFKKLHFFKMNYVMLKSSNFMELVYKNNSLLLIFR